MGLSFWVPSCRDLLVHALLAELRCCTLVDDDTTHTPSASMRANKL